MKNLIIQIQGLGNAVGKGIISYGSYVGFSNELIKDYLEGDKK